MTSIAARIIPRPREVRGGGRRGFVVSILVTEAVLAVRARRTTNVRTARRRWMRRITRIAALLVAGAVLNVLVAWAAVLRPSDPSKWKLQEVKPTRGWFGEAPPAWPQPQREYSGRTYGVTMGTRSAQLQEQSSVQIFTMGALDSGWPLRCLRVRERVHVSVIATGMTLKSNPVGTTLPEPWWQRGIRVRDVTYGLRSRLPTRPLAFPFLINTISFAIAVGMLVAGTGAVRRVVRRRRGKCVACGYDVRGLPVCPECGKPADAA
jgi:hypothetical protein